MKIFDRLLKILTDLCEYTKTVYTLAIGSEGGDVGVNAGY